jgi:hypothetical protein
MNETPEPRVRSVTDPAERPKDGIEVKRRSAGLRSQHPDRSAADASLRPLARALLALAEQLREERTA